jgi:hypothetical protein
MSRTRVSAFRAAVAALALGGSALANPLVIEQRIESVAPQAASWSIAHAIAPPTADLHPGDNQAFGHTVTVTRTPTATTAFTLRADATLHNTGRIPLSLATVAATLGEAAVELDCGVPMPHTLAGGERLHCGYRAERAEPGATSSVIFATLAMPTAGRGEPTTVRHAEALQLAPLDDGITVVTSDGQSFEFSDSGSADYTVSHGCVDHQSSLIASTATIVETGASATAQARLFCHVLRVVRSVDTGFDRAWSWDIEKTHAESPPLVLTAGQTYQVPYTITATATATDSALVANGEIAINNTNPVKPAELQSVLVEVAGVGAASVECPSLVIAKNTIMTCSFSAALPDASPRVATVTVTQRNFDHAQDGSATANGDSRQFVGQLQIAPGGSPGAETDRCATLSDDYLGETHALGGACADASPVVRSFTGPIVVAADSACAFEVENLARLVADDSGSEATSGTSIAVVRSDCDDGEGCVLTPGYWKTHSLHGPAPYDATWALVGEDTPFFLATAADGSPLGWHAVLWTAPRGNAYFILARAWIAATLNGLNGASASTQVLDALAEAQALFESWTVEAMGALRGNQAPRPRVLELAGILDMYNNGIGDLGPPSCSEDGSSARD